MSPIKEEALQAAPSENIRTKNLVENANRHLTISYNTIDHQQKQALPIGSLNYEQLSKKNLSENKKFGCLTPVGL